MNNEDRGDYSDAKYDEWSGFNEKLFNTGEYDDEDKEADSVYSLIDMHMDARRKSRRDKNNEEKLN